MGRSFARERWRPEGKRWFWACCCCCYGSRRCCLCRCGCGRCAQPPPREQLGAAPGREASLGFCSLEDRAAFWAPASRDAPHGAKDVVALVTLRELGPGLAAAAACPPVLAGLRPGVPGRASRRGGCVLLAQESPGWRRRAIHASAAGCIPAGPCWGCTAWADSPAATCAGSPELPFSLAVAASRRGGLGCPGPERLTQAASFPS